jgi:hypothetical protein
VNRLPLLLLLGGCSWLRAEKQVDPLTARLQQADAAWRARATAGIEPAASALSGLLADAPLDGRVLWRQARLRWLQGFLNPDPAGARNDWETGREYALGCLAGDPDVAASLRQGAWRISSASLSTTTPEQRPCLLWAAGNSLALVELRGSGGLLDAESACAMADRASQIVGPAEPGLLDWEMGTCAWWLAGDPAAATLAWQQAQASSGNYLYALAMVTHVPETPPELHDADEYALEKARALAIWAQRP